MRRILLVVVLLIVAYAIGFVPERMKARRAQGESSRLRFELGLARLQGRLGMVCQEADRNDFASAAAESSEFFNALRSSLSTADLAADAKRKSLLESIAARRDEVTADLARQDPEVKDKLAGLYLELVRAIEGTSLSPSQSPSPGYEKTPRPPVADGDLFDPQDEGRCPQVASFRIGALEGRDLLERGDHGPLEPGVDEVFLDAPAVFFAKTLARRALQRLDQFARGSPSKTAQSGPPRTLGTGLA